MRVLITGGNGMVGRNLVDYLKTKSELTLFFPSSTELNLLDCAKTIKYVSHIKPDIIIHCAGVVGGIQANIAQPYRFLNINLQLGINLINASIQAGVHKLINLGSSCMYPKDRNTMLEEKDLLDGKLEPTNEGYALSKLTIAKLCDFANKELKVEYKTIIPCNLYGKYDKFDPINSHMIPAVIRKLHEAKRNNTPAEIWGDGSARREFMYAEDLADFIFFAIKNYEHIDPIMNLGMGHDYSIKEYYHRIAEVIGFNGGFTYNSSKPVGMKRKLCSIEKQKRLGWKPKHSLISGLEKTNQFYIENYGV